LADDCRLDALLACLALVPAMLILNEVQADLMDIKDPERNHLTTMFFQEIKNSKSKTYNE